jgi:hypothetical protein
MELSPFGSRRMVAVPDILDARRTRDVSTPAERRSPRIASPNPSLPTTPTIKARPPSRAAAQDWLAPLPPVDVARSPPRTVSPGTGRRATRWTMSRFRLPNTTIRPAAECVMCEVDERNGGEAAPSSPKKYAISGVTVHEGQRKHCAALAHGTVAHTRRRERETQDEPIGSVGVRSMWATWRVGLVCVIGRPPAPRSVTSLRTRDMGAAPGLQCEAANGEPRARAPFEPKPGLGTIERVSATTTSITYDVVVTRRVTRLPVDLALGAAPAHRPTSAPARVSVVPGPPRGRPPRRRRVPTPRPRSSPAD